jgi:hypothetical protein
LRQNAANEGIATAGGALPLTLTCLSFLRCLAALTKGVLTAALDLHKDKILPEFLFKGSNILSIHEGAFHLLAKMILIP